MMDSASIEKRFYREALRMGPPREIDICWMEKASRAQRIAKAKAFRYESL